MFGDRRKLAELTESWQAVPNHLLRLIDRHVNFESIRAKLKDLYSDAGRPSIDPELLLRMLLVVVASARRRAAVREASIGALNSSKKPTWGE